MNVAAIVGPFVAAAAAAGVKPPVRILGADARGWELLERRGDVLVLDEYGELWWAKHLPREEARVIRACWPEEVRSLSATIAASLPSPIRDASSR